MSQTEVVIKARTRRFAALNYMAEWYGRLAVSCEHLIALYEDSDERDEKAYQQICSMKETAQKKLDSLSVFLLKEREWLDRHVFNEDCEARQ